MERHAQGTQFETLHIEHIKEEAQKIAQVIDQVSKVVIGQTKAIESMVLALLCNGHILLEGVPGVAKTTMIKSIAQALGLKFTRIQFTPDLMPADVIGTMIYNAKTHEFETRKGPIFANLILADEINRAPAKVQSALLEAMQEQQVTIGSTSYHLDKPFFVFATQNPIEQEGTYRLPEAQVDRFMFKISVNYPSREHERQMILSKQLKPTITPVISGAELNSMQGIVESVYCDPKILDYILSLVFATRDPESYNLKILKSYITSGASPRATIALVHASKAYAFLKQRHYIIPDDVKAVAYDILCHRISLSYGAESENIQAFHIIQKIINTIPTP